MTTANYPSDYTKTEKEVFDKSVVGPKEPPGRLSAPKSGVKKLLNYPIARRNEEKLVQYLQIQIADYTPPGLNVNAFKLEPEKNDVGLVKGESGSRIVNISKSSGLGDFSAVRGSDANRKSFGPDKDGKPKKSIKHIINLPIPRNVTDTQGVQYGESQLNPLQAFGTALVGQGFSSQQPIAQLKQAFAATANKAGGLLQDEATQKAIGASLAGTMIGALGGNVSADQLIARASGQILNPNLELLFNGVGLRVFPFSFQFFPRSKEEADEVMKIIRVLKFEMAPTRNGQKDPKSGVFVGTPSVFQLVYMGGSEQHPFLNKFLPMVLSDMKVNYTASGSHSTFYDGTPTHMQVDLQFKELNPIFKEDYEGQGGVGY